MVKQNLFKIHQIENYKTYLKNKHKSNIGMRKRTINKIISWKLRDKSNTEYRWSF